MAQVRPLHPDQNFEILREWLRYRDEYVANVEDAAKVNRVAVRAEVEYLQHHEEDHTEGSLQAKLETFSFVVYFRDEAQAMAEETWRKMLALQNMGTALREEIAHLAVLSREAVPLGMLFACC